MFSAGDADADAPPAANSRLFVIGIVTELVLFIAHFVSFSVYFVFIAPAASLPVSFIFIARSVSVSFTFSIYISAIPLVSVGCLFRMD